MMVVKLPKEERDQLVRNIQSYFLDDRGEEIGELAAGLLLDFFLKEAAPYAYNQGVKDAKQLIQEKVLSIEEDLDSLQRPVNLHGRY